MHIHDKPNSNYIRQTILMVCLCFLMGTSMAQSVGIGTTTPNGSALLDISSNNKGLLIPRMTTAQRDAIASPAMGLQIINTDDMCIDRFDGANWIKTCGAKQIGTVTVSPDLTVQKGNLPRPSINAVAFVIGNKAYYTTGQASFINGQLVQGNQLWEWDGASQQWSRKADFPVAGSRSYATGFAIGTKGYVGLGWDGTFYKDWWEYDPVNNTWTRRADYPGEGSDGCYAFVIGSKGYVGTGRGPSGDVPVDFWEYDPVFNTWTRRANMPTSVPTVSGWGGYFRGVSFAIGGKGYGALGYNSYLGCAFCSRVTQLLEYDPLANTWIRKADFPMPTGLSFNSLVEGASFVIGSNAYVGAMANDNAIWRYTPASNTWTKVVNLDGPPFSKAVGFAIGTSGYIAGSDFPHLKLWEYRTEPTQVPVFNMASAPLASQVNDGIWTRSGQTIYTSTVGNVGINDNAPAAKLSIAGNVKIADGSQGAGKVLTSDASGVANWQSLPPIPTQFWAANGNNISATNSGNVGIGTASPNGRLQFNNHINNRIVVLNESGSNEHNFFGFGINNFTLRYQIADAFQSHVFFAGNAQNNATGSNELFRIRGNGNVGIRQSNPNAPLQFSNDVANRKIVLFEAANNDHQYFGLGVNNGTFRYQMPVTSDAHVFFAGTGTGSSNELMRIQGNGNVGIGQGNPQVPLHFATVLGKKISLYRGPLGDAGFGVFGNELRIHSDYNGADITFGFDDFTNGFTERFRVRGNGNATLAGTLTQNSDARLKKDIAPLHNTLASLLQINGYSYHWKSEAADQSEQIGLLAQELQKVYPQLVKEQDGKLSVNYSGMIPLLLEAVKEQQTEIAELKKLVQQLLRQ